MQARHAGLEFAIWYWHFVDVVWLFLYVFVYVWGSAQADASGEVPPSTPAVADGDKAVDTVERGPLKHNPQTRAQWWAEAPNSERVVFVLGHALFIATFAAFIYCVYYTADFDAAFKAAEKRWGKDD